MTQVTTGNTSNYFFYTFGNKTSNVVHNICVHLIHMCMVRPGQQHFSDNISTMFYSVWDFTLSFSIMLLTSFIVYPENLMRDMTLIDFSASKNYLSLPEYLALLFKWIWFLISFLISTEAWRQEEKICLLGPLLPDNIH